jgi:hypothetical protein
MVTDTDTTPIASRKSGMRAQTPPENTSDASFHNAFRDVCGDINGMTLDRVVRVLDAPGDRGGSRSLGELMVIVHDAPRPLNAIMAMVACGLIGFAEGHAFDARLPVYRRV